jgi:hypothetical protein
MAFIPPGIQWYVADVVLEVRVSGASDRRAWVNTYLIQAATPDEAFEKAQRIGSDSESSYVNAEGVEVTHTFRGNGDLQVVLGPLEDGAEIGWSEYSDMTPDDVADLVIPKDDLAVFLPIEPEMDPRYVPREMWEAHHKRESDELTEA